MSAGTDGQQIRVADETDVKPVGQLIADAFQEPVTEWLIPDPGDRRRITPHFFGLVADDALAAGKVYVYGDYLGAAIWFDLATPHDAGAEGRDPRYDEVMGPYLDRWTTLAEIMDLNHPTRPHQYLMFLGCRPDQQGRGIGSALLRHHHEQIRERGLSAYLEATSDRSRQLYLRHGYRDFAPPYRLPGGPPLWPMWRTADILTPG